MQQLKIKVKKYENFQSKFKEINEEIVKLSKFINDEYSTKIDKVKKYDFSSKKI